MNFKMYLKSQNFFGSLKSRQNCRSPQEQFLFPSTSISNLSQRYFNSSLKKIPQRSTYLEWSWCNKVLIERNQFPILLSYYAVRKKCTYLLWLRFSYLSPAVERQPYLFPGPAAKQNSTCHPTQKYLASQLHQGSSFACVYFLDKEMRLTAVDHRNLLVVKICGFYQSCSPFGLSCIPVWVLKIANGKYFHTQWLISFSLRSKILGWL